MATRMRGLRLHDDIWSLVDHVAKTQQISRSTWIRRLICAKLKDLGHGDQVKRFKPMEKAGRPKKGVKSVEQNMGNGANPEYLSNETQENAVPESAKRNNMPPASNHVAVLDPELVVDPEVYQGSPEEGSQDIPW